jgi:FkbM family methyltransferase
MRTLLRRALEARGYYLRHKKFLPYGVDYMLDITRLSTAWGLSVRTFFDVGANCGETSKWALSQFPDASVWGFEPSASTFSTLCENLRDEPRFSGHRIALGETCGMVPFFEYESCLYNSLIPNTPPGSAGARQTEVRCLTLDEFCLRFGIKTIDVLKVDAERCDLMVLRGGRQMMGQVRFVYFEFNSMVPRSGVTESTLSEIGQFLSSFGFQFVATYIERIETSPMFVVANGLFVRPPDDSEIRNSAELPPSIAERGS